MTVQANDILKVIFEVALADGTIAQNVYYLYAALLAPQADLSVINAIEVWMEDAYGELTAELVNTITQRVCTVQEVRFNGTENQWEVYRTLGYFTPTVSYNNASQALPNQSSAYATFNTSRPKSRGRKFLFPFGEDRQDGTYLTAAALANMADYATDILNGILLGPGNNLFSGIVRATVADFLGFDVGIVTDLLGTQRRRKPGVGA